MIKPVYRVQCDGPGREWLALPDDYEPGTNITPDALVAASTAERAGSWPSEKEAKRAGFGAGWRYAPDSNFEAIFCPACQNPGPARPDEEPTT